MKFSLSFKGPFSWPGLPGAPSIFESEFADQVGIYLWSVHLQDGALIYYVGETGRSFKERLLQHFAEHVAGMYHLYEPTEFSKGNRVIVWPGRYDFNNRKTPAECVREYGKLDQLIKQMNLALRFHIAVLTCETRFRRRIEAAIAEHLYRQKGMIGAFQEKIRYQPRREDEEPITAVLTSDHPLLGLPSELLA